MKKTLINIFPATNWRDASPVGNGRLGASVYGAVYDERILINHESLYNWASRKDIPDVSDALPEVRKLMDEKKYKEANDYYTKLLESKGYRSSKGKFFPAFDLHMIFSCEEAFCDYSREIDLETGICKIKYYDNGHLFKRTIFAMQNGCIYINLKKEGKFSLSFSLERHDMNDYIGYQNWDTFNSFAYKDAVYSVCRTGGNLHYSGMVKVLSTDGIIGDTGIAELPKIDMSGEIRLNSSLNIRDASEITLLIDVSEKAQDYDIMYEQISKGAKPFEEAKRVQKTKFKKLFNRVVLDLGNKERKNISNEQLLLDGYNGNVSNALIEKMADYGRYLLISSSYGCKYPSNLQGLWNGDYSPAWACTFFNNENIQMMYWQACKGDLSETLLPLFNLYDSMKEDYRYNARQLFGCRGILLPLFMDNVSGRKDNLQPHVLYWTGSSSWISSIYFEYYLYTKDETFLAEKAYPFMKESLLFYEDFVKYDENGMIKFYPSNSPENRADGSFEGAKELSISINATMDFALLKELLTNSIFAAKKLNVDEDKITIWSKMLNAIPDYRINKDGAICEWMHDDFKDNYHHRHQSHIYPLFPGHEINKETNEKLFNACKIAVEKRLCIGLKEQTGWSFAHMANIFARLGESEKALDCLKLLTRFCTGNNLYTYHNDWRNMGVTLKYMHAGHAPYQIDANMGFTSAVYEMLFYSDTQKMKILPSLPKEWKNGMIDGIVSMSGEKVTIKWEKSRATVLIKSKKDTIINIASSEDFSLINKEMYRQSGFSKEYITIDLMKNKPVKLEYERIGEKKQ